MQVTKFQKLYQARFNKKISLEDAYDQGVKLVRLMKIIYKPITKEDYQKLQQRRQTT